MPHKVTRKSGLFGIIAVALWLLFFAGGILINSEHYRKQLESSLNLNLTNFILATILYTPTNAAILSCLAGLVGGCASNVVMGHEEFEKLAKDVAEDETITIRARRRVLFMTEPPFLSLLRGFVVYLAFLSGILIATENPFKDGSGVQFMRYAGFISLMAFGMGYDPTRFEALLANIPTIGSRKSAKNA